MIVGELAAAGIRRGALDEAFRSLDAHAGDVSQPRFLTLIDFSRRSTSPRMHVIDLETGAHESLLVAHGKGSDPDHDGFADRFSNVVGSEMSSVGAYRTGEIYYGENGLSLRLVGLDPSNDKAVERAIVMHGADYVSPYRPVLGRSQGCPAIEPKHVSRVLPMLSGGTFLYIAR